MSVANHVMVQTAVDRLGRKKPNQLLLDVLEDWDG